MPESLSSIPTEIRITGINTDKTRKDNGSETRYKVYFRLSTLPPQPWRDLFIQEWKKLYPSEPEIWQAVNIDMDFLVLHCPLVEIETMRLPVLKQAVAATNLRYRQYVQDQATEKTRREHIWSDERDAVERMAKSLRFDK